MSDPIVLGVERTNNPHLIPIFDELRQQPGIRFTGCVLEPLKPWRVELGWPELDERSPHLQPFRRAADRARYLELARVADVVIWPGLKFRGSIRLLLVRNLCRRLNVVWAERFTERRQRAWYQTLAMKAVVRLMNSKNMHLMTLGSGALDDYQGFGATRWTAWEFGYAVQPVAAAALRTRRAATGELRLVFIGSLRSKKGVDVLLRALGSPALAAGGWRLKIVGDGRERQQLEALAAELGISARVEFAGVAPHERVGALYQESDVLVLPSRYEGWGAVINEAMEHGVAVVASDGAGAARMLVEQGDSGFVFSSGDQVALADCLARLVADRALCDRMGAAGRRRIEQFRPQAAAKRVAALLRGLTGSGALPDYREGLCRRLP